MTLQWGEGKERNKRCWLVKLSCSRRAVRGSRFLRLGEEEDEGALAEGEEEEERESDTAGTAKEIVLVAEEDAEVLTGAVKEVRMEAWRNIAGRPFPAVADKEARKDVERALMAAVGWLEGDEAGEYWELSELEPDVESELETEDLMLCKPKKNTLHVASGAARDWPDQRGVFFSEDKGCVLWCNGLDHATIVVLERGWQAGAALQRFLRLYRALEAGLRRQGMRFSVDKGLGFLGTSPERLGLAFRASVTVALPTAKKDTAPLKKVCEREALRLERKKRSDEEQQAEGGEGEDEEWRVESRRVYGISEVDVVHALLQGVVQLRHVAKELKGLASR